MWHDSRLCNLFGGFIRNTWNEISVPKLCHIVIAVIISSNIELFTFWTGWDWMKKMAPAVKVLVEDNNQFILHDNGRWHKRQGK